jgi:peptide-methionine (R)-S-oxide reductase
MMTRRNTLFSLGAVVAAIAGVRGLFEPTLVHAAQVFPLKRTDAEWKKMLSPDQYQVLRQAGTEAPYTSPLNKEKRTGTFGCAGCAQALFASNTKFESGTGWPSFYQPIAKTAVVEETDRTLGMKRTEVLCSNCGGHLGHVFDDGPKPTGLRYCMNGLSLNFKAA